MYREARLASDPEQLVQRLPERAVLAPHVADVAPPRVRGDARELDDLLRRREGARIVLESRGEPERTGGHLLAHEIPHARDLGGHRRAPPVVAHHALAYRAVSDERRDVHGGRRAFQPFEPRRERKS